ncbi:protein of unknown function [Paraburkholderia kururiensis]
MDGRSGQTLACPLSRPPYRLFEIPRGQALTSAPELLRPEDDVLAIVAKPVRRSAQCEDG